MITNILEIQLQTVFYPGFSKLNIISVQAPSLRKEILFGDKCDDNHVAASQIWQLLLYAWHGLVGKANGRASTLVFPFGGGGKKVTHCFIMYLWM